MDSPELIGRLQHRLVHCGLLAGSFPFGVFDEKTSDAVETMLIEWAKQKGILQ